MSPSEQSDSEVASQSTEKISLAQKYQDKIVWLLGLVFLVCLLGAMFGIGALRGWDAQSGWQHNESTSSQKRFLSEPFEEEPGVKGRQGKHRTGFWYYWKLDPDDVTWYTQLCSWSGYLLHQFTCWTGLYMLQRAKRTLENQEVIPENTVLKASSQLTFWNWFLLGTNLGFHLLHLLITHVTYDATAQDVSISSSQSSVIMLLIFVMILEYRDRGLFFGWPSRYDKGKWSERLKLTYLPMYLVRRYHGYAFAWAAIYTFWYHPMESTWGHATGFAHTFIILHQGSLAFTKVHYNKYWRLVLESWVIIHSGVVAKQTGGSSLLGTRMWPMFVFGFSLVFVLTQIYGLPFWRKIHPAFRVIPVAVYIALVLYCYSWIPDSRGKTWVRIQEIIRIPGVYYISFFFVWLWSFLFLKLYDCCSSKTAELTKKTEALSLVGNVLIYLVFIVISVLIQFFDWNSIDMIALMVILVMVFMLGVSVSQILLLKLFGIQRDQID